MANPFHVTGTFTGLDDALKDLATLADKAQRRVLRKALKRAAKPIVKAVRERIPTKSKLLKKSIASKVFAPTADQVTAEIAPRAGFGETVTRPAEGEPHRHGAKTVKADPILYAHLVDGGTKPHAIGKGSRLKKKVQKGKEHPGTKGVKFMEKGWEAAQAEAEQIARDEITAGVVAEWEKARG